MYLFVCLIIVRLFFTLQSTRSSSSLLPTALIPHAIPDRVRNPSRSASHSTPIRRLEAIF
jgi:hypothetical protein